MRKQRKNQAGENDKRRSRFFFSSQEASVRASTGFEFCGEKMRMDEVDNDLIESFKRDIRSNAALFFLVPKRPL